MLFATAHPLVMRRAAVQWAAVGIGLILVVHLALLRFERLVVDVGEQASEPLLDGFWYAERAPEQAGGFSYQWSTASSTVLLPALATNDAWRVELRAWQEGMQAKALHLRAGDAALSIPVLPGVRRYHALIPRLHPLTLTARVATADPTQQIGLGVDSVRATRQAAHPILDGSVVLGGVLVAAFLGFLVSTAGLGRGDTLLTVTGAALLLFLAFDRYPVYAFRGLPRFNTVLASVLISAAVVYSVAVIRYRVLPGYVIAALALIVVLKLVGVCYPGFVGLDTAHHIRGVQEAIQGTLYRVSEGQGQRFPYPPAVYLLMAPFVLLWPGVHWIDLQWFVTFASVLLDSSTLLLLYGILNQPAVAVAVRRWAVLLYAILPAGFLLFYHGTIAQNVGQWLGLCYLAALVRCLVHAETWSWVRALGLIALSFLASLGHFGVFLNLNLMFVLLVLVFPRFAAHHRLVLGTWFVGAALSAAVYYSAFLPLIQEQLGQLTQTADAPSAGRLFMLQRFVWDLGIEDHYLGVYAVLAAVGLVLLLRWERSEPVRSVTRLFGVMLLTSLVLGVLLVVARVNVTRFVIFSHTAIVIFAAVVLSGVDRSRGGWLVSRALVCYTLGVSLAVWASGFALHVKIGWLE